MTMFLSGTFSCLKTSLSIVMADRLNIANIISTDLIKVMMDSLRSNLKLPTQQDILKGFCTIDQFLQLNQHYWKGACMDVSKVFNEGKPLLFEGTINFNGVIDSPYVPTQERWELAKRFIDGDKTLNYDSLFDELNPNVEGKAAGKFKDLNWLKQNATGAELNIINEFEKCKDVPAVIIPIILIISKDDHKHIIKEKLLKELPWQEKYFQSISNLKSVQRNILRIFQEIQERLIKESPGILVPITLSHYDKNCDIIQNISLKQIENQFYKNTIEGAEKHTKKTEEHTKTEKVKLTSEQPQHKTAETAQLDEKKQ